jgi:hypothetical protein
MLRVRSKLIIGGNFNPMNPVSRISLLYLFFILLKLAVTDILLVAKIGCGHAAVLMLLDKTLPFFLCNKSL